MPSSAAAGARGSACAARAALGRPCRSCGVPLCTRSATCPPSPLSLARTSRQAMTRLARPRGRPAFKGAEEMGGMRSQRAALRCSVHRLLLLPLLPPGGAKEAALQLPGATLPPSLQLRSARLAQLRHHAPFAAAGGTPLAAAASGSKKQLRMSSPGAPGGGQGGQGWVGA